LPTNKLPKNKKYMKKRTLLYALPILAGAMLISDLAISKLDNFTSVNRAGDPVGPGVTSRKDCSSCHNGIDVIVNDNVKRMFTFDSGSVYTPGATHVIKFKILASGTVGFSSTVLKNDSNIKAGVIAPIDTNESKVFTHATSGRTYLNHRVGTTANGMKEYSFQWTAPAKGSGPVTFYFSSLSSNLDDGTSDDTVYNNSYVITEKVTIPEGLNSSSLNTEMSVYPNPASDKINVSFNNTTKGLTSVTMFSYDGKQTISLMNEVLNSGSQSLNLNLPADVKPGIYFIRVSNSNMNAVHKILVN
jgi:Secretion system C-terminal sorting domain